MTYLRVRNFWNYQNADAWKKAKANKKGHKHPAWCKLYVARDFELDAERPIVRLVFLELLKLATIYANVIPNNSQLIANAISLPPKDVAQAIEELLNGAWLTETQSARRSREPSRKIPDQIEVEIEVEIDKPQASNGNGGLEISSARELHMHLLKSGSEEVA